MDSSSDDDSDSVVQLKSSTRGSRHRKVPAKLRDTVAAEHAELDMSSMF